MERYFNSTIKRNGKVCKRCGKGPLFSRGRCAQCAKIEDNQEKEETESGESMAYLISDLDALCSLIVRMSAADENGIAVCYTCGNKMRWQELQNGHYEKRGKSVYLRWDFRNLRPQCENCNVHKRGNLAVYGKKLELEKPGITEILYEEGNLVHKWSRDELRAMVIDFNKQVDALKKKFK